MKIFGFYKWQLSTTYKKLDIFCQYGLYLDFDFPSESPSNDFNFASSWRIFSSLLFAAAVELLLPADKTEGRLDCVSVLEELNEVEFAYLTCNS